MISAQESRKFVGRPVSLGALGRIEGWPRPYSLRAILGATNRRYGEGTFSTGDVTCRYQVAAWDSGRWSIKADFSDNGDVLGDYYLLEVTFGGHEVGTKIEGQLGGRVFGPRRSASELRNGVDPWIRDNWASVHDKGFQLTLKASVDFAPIGTAIGIILGGWIAIAFASGDGDASVEICRDQQPGEPQPCYRYHQNPNP